jgi:hypothetical protein
MVGVLDPKPALLIEFEESRNKVHIHLMLGNRTPGRYEHPRAKTRRG